MTMLLPMLLAAVFTQADMPDETRLRPIEYALDDVYMPTCQMPVRYRGFSFSDNGSEMAEMTALGANVVGEGRMWIPVQDPNAPYGAGTVSFAAGSLNGEPLAQVFRAPEAFVGVEWPTPTFTSTGSGATMALYAGDRLIAEKVFTDVADNAWMRLTFDEQPAGEYRLELRNRTGDSIGVWAVMGDPYPDGVALLGGTPAADMDFELAIITAADERVELVSPTGNHRPVRLGADWLGLLEELGIATDMSLGNWNNGGFPYYPKWFYEAFPDMTMIDANGQPFMAGMFDELFGWPSIDHPAIVDGTRRQIRRYVAELADADPIIMWTLGGEALYPTYMFAGRWSDYGANALAHFRAWLERKYTSIDALNAAWGEGFGSFDEVEAPREASVSVPWSDFIDYRFSAMAERFGWHYKSVRYEDTSRLTATCNHGDLYHGEAYAAMGARPDLYASMADGWETGQIMSDDDAKRFNLLYCEGLASFGKPVAPVRLAYKFTDPTARGGGTSFTPEAARRYMYECLGWGNWYVGYIQWRGDLPDGEWGVKGTPAIPEIERVFGEIEESTPELTNMRPLKPRVGLYFSHPVWSLRGFGDEWIAIHDLLVRNHVPKVHLYDTQIADDRLDGIDIILSVSNDIISDAVMAGLERFVARGGRVVSWGDFGTLNQQLTPRERPVWVSGPGVAMVDGPVSETLPRVMQRLSATTPVRPWQLDAGGAMAYEPRTFETSAAHDTPHDLANTETMGQTFTVEEGHLLSVSACLPTYVHTPAEFGATMELLSGGPDGERLAEASLSPAEIQDCGWYEVTLPQPEPVGTYYLRVTPEAGITPSNLGIWGTAGDTYALGTRYVNDEPSSGDLRLQVQTEALTPVEQQIESFVLADGLNLLGVFINTGAEQVSLSARLDERILPDPGGAYRALELPSRRVLADDATTEAGAPLELAPCGTAMVYLERVVGETIGRQAAQRLTDATPGTVYGEFLQEAAVEFAQAQNWPKVAALAASLASQLTVVAEPVEGATVAYDLHLADGAGAPIVGARVIAELVPSEAQFVEWADMGGGRYELRLDHDDLPLEYDYEQRRYVPFVGPLRLTITARAADLRGQCIVDAMVP